MPPSRSHRNPGWTSWVETESTKAGYCSLARSHTTHVLRLCTRQETDNRLRIHDNGHRRSDGVEHLGFWTCLALWILTNADIEVGGVYLTKDRS